MSDSKRYTEMFDYLSVPVVSQEAHGVLAFGRKDFLVAQKIVDLARDDFSNYVVISGGVGKDSGDLAVPEAEYLAQGAEEIAKNTATPLPRMYIETQARNGSENVRNSLQLMRRAQLPYKAGLITVAHATSSRRLNAMVAHETTIQNDPIDNIYSLPTAYNFDPSNPADQKEAVAELLRLADWPDKGWLFPQDDLPENLVDFARDKS